MPSPTREIEMEFESAVAAEEDYIKLGGVLQGEYEVINIPKSLLPENFDVSTTTTIAAQLPIKCNLRVLEDTATKIDIL